MAAMRARAPGRPKPGSIPSGDRSRYAAAEGSSCLQVQAIYMGSRH